MSCMGTRGVTVIPPELVRYDHQFRTHANVGSLSCAVASSGPTTRPALALVVLLFFSKPALFYQHSFLKFWL